MCVRHCWYAGGERGAIGAHIDTSVASPYMCACVTSRLSLYCFLQHHDALLPWLASAVTTLLAFVFWVIWGSFGVLLFATKVLSLRKVSSIWRREWDGKVDQESHGIDLQTYNFLSTVELLLETLPQLVIQSSNNAILGRWSGLGIASVAFGSFFTLNRIVTLVYYKFYKGMPVLDIPIDSEGRREKAKQPETKQVTNVMMHEM